MRIIFLLLLLLFGNNILASDLLFNKSSPQLQKVLSSVVSSNDSVLSLWLTLDVALEQKEIVELSEKSLRRRNKVDPINSLVDEKDYTISQYLIDSLQNLGAEIRHNLYWFDAITINLSTSDLPRLARLSFVKEIDLVQKLVSHRVFLIEPFKKQFAKPHSALSLPYGLSEYQNRFIKADKLHSAGFTGNGVRIAMFDTGFNTFHRAFDSANIINTYNFIDNIVDVTQVDCNTSVPQTSHGTMTFGVIGSYLPDTIIGVAYNAEFLLAKTEISCFGTEVVQEEDNWIAAAQWADLQGADIISSSLGYITFQDATGYTFADLDGDTPRITIAADIAASKNILVINSAGNERGSNWNHIVTPSDGDSVIAVGAVNRDSSLAGFSSPGPSADGRIKPDITTLGTTVATTTFTGGVTANISGTSFSAPLVAGAVALAIEHDSTLTAEELRNLIRNSGNRFLNPDNNFGYGLFDAVKTADIIKFDKPYNFLLSNDGVDRFLVETSGRAKNMPVLALLDTISGVTITDNNDGSAYIDIDFTAIRVPIQTIRITADVGYFVDTTEFTIISQKTIKNKLIIGPNPCTDFVNIYFYDALNFKSLTIHTISGEKVWELFNNYTFDADINRIEARWNCNNQSGEVVADGTYIIVVSAGGKQFHQKVLKIE